MFSLRFRISANIITRGPQQRSLGYGFVEMESEEDANKAVQLLNKKEIDGRPVNVEVAKPRDESGEDKTRGASGNRGFGRGTLLLPFFLCIRVIEK